MVYIGLSYVVGLFFASIFNFTGEIFVVLLLILVASFLFKTAGIRFVYFIASALMFVSGFSVYRIYTENVYKKIIQYDGINVTYSGTIKEIKDYQGEKSRYIISGIINSEQKADIVYYGETLECEYNDRIEFSATLRSFENKFIFKEKDYYQSRGIYLTAQNVSGAVVKKDNSFSFIRKIRGYSDYINKKISTILPGENGALIIAMLSGDKSGLDDSSVSAIYRFGIGHMMAVSGMHLIFMVSFISFFLDRLKIHRFSRFILLEIFIIIFVIFTGMSVSVIRAAFMMTLINGAIIFGRQNDPFNSLCIAAFVLLLPQPYLIRNSSFLLSVAGTYGAAVFAPALTKEMSDENFLNRFVKNIVVMFCISSAVFPFSVMFFDETSVISPITNIIATPLCMIVLGSGLVTAFTGGIDVIAYPAVMIGGLAGKLIIKLSEISASLRMTTPLKVNYIMIFTVLVVVFMIITFYRFKKGRYVLISLIISMMIGCILGAVYRYTENEVVTIYRTGNKKSAALVIARGSNADIIDLTGGAKSSEYVLKVVNGYGIKNINSIVFLKNPYQSMASYNDVLCFEDIRKVYVPSDTYLYNDYEICGCVPEKSEICEMEYIYKDYSVSFEKDDSILISYGDVSISCSDAGFYCENAGREYNGENFYIKIGKSGKMDFYSLE